MFLLLQRFVFLFGTYAAVCHTGWHMGTITEIRTEALDGHKNPEDHHVANRVGLVPDQVQVVNVFTLEGLSPNQAQDVLELLHDSVTQRASSEPRRDWDDPHIIEIAPRPGAMDPDAAPILNVLDYLGIEVTGVQTSTEYHLADDVPRETVDKAAKELGNKEIQYVRTQPVTTLEVESHAEPIRHYDMRAMSDEELMELSHTRKVEMSLKEMQAIRDESIRLDRPITDGEIEYLGGAWSEHCRHKTFNAEIIDANGNLKPALFWRIKNGSKPYFEERGVLSAFDDNSGVWAFYDGTALCIKLETHNSPMNLEPYGGSATGTGGVLRDIVGTGKGARVINSFHIQCTAPLDMPNELVPESCHTPRHLMERSVAGVGDYGNRMGIPTNDVSFHTDERFRGKSTVLVGAMGLMPEANAQKGQAEHGDFVVAVGGKTGRDGVHGANFSSVGADSGTAEKHSGAVQIGMAIEEKMVFDAILEASERGLIRAMTDCGASGFASAIGEMGEEIGVQIDLAHAPLKYAGLSPWEIFISESQERMVLAVDPENYEELAAIFDKHGSNCDILGNFGSPEGEDPTLHVEYAGETLVHLDYGFIKNGVPIDPLEAIWEAPALTERQPHKADLKDVLTNVLKNGNVCSTEPIVRQYDHEVQGTSALKPYDGVNGHGRNDAVVLTPILGKPYAAVEAHGTNPTLTELDPARGTKWVYAEAVSNYVAAGGNPDDMIAVNNYISAKPTARVMGALDLSVDTLMDECVAEFHSPVISGKDSLSSTFVDTDGTVIEAPYNLTVTVAGKLPDVSRTVSSDIKEPGSVLVLLGKQDLAAMGGSIYYDTMNGVSATVPDVDIPEFHKTTRSLHAAMQQGLVSAAKSVKEGGVVTAVAEMLFGGDCGADLDIADMNELFNETTGTFVIELADETIAASLFSNLDYKVIGRTKPEKQLSVAGHDDMAVDELMAAWQRPFEEVFA